MDPLLTSLLWRALSINVLEKVVEEELLLLVGGVNKKKCHFFKLPLDHFWVAKSTQIALNMIPVKFGWKKITTSLPNNPPKSAFFSY